MSASLDHNIQMCTRTNRGQTDRLSAYAQIIRFGPICTYITVELVMMQSISEQCFEYQGIWEAEKKKMHTFVHPLTSRREYIRPFVLHGISGCVEVELVSRCWGPIAGVQLNYSRCSSDSSSTKSQSTVEIIFYSRGAIASHPPWVTVFADRNAVVSMN